MACMAYSLLVSNYEYQIFGWDALRRICSLTDRHDKAAVINEKIKSLLDTNPASQKLKKYMYLLEELSVC